MVNTIMLPSVQVDLAGTVYSQPNLFQIQKRLRQLVQRYVTQDILRDRLEDLPQQFAHPSPRPWQAIDWQGIHPDQIIGIDPQIFLATLSGTIDTEAPIRGYTQASRQYLAFNYPHMARFVGGQLDQNNTLVELGLWEKEERRHTPTLTKLYTLLAGHQPTVTPHNARAYRPSQDPRESLYRHGLHRVATEYGATCLYLWMMAYTTGPLQAVLAEVLIDEIN
ncbi:MAG: ferritin-like domain-containing protein, partial [Cyanobacteria bacterium J06659_2]